MRRLTTAVLAALLLVVGCSGGDRSASTAATTSLAEQTRTVGDVEVKALPTQLDPSGAAFAITLDTHADSLTTDLAATTTLDVNATRWPTKGWSGDPSSGHHRTGTLRFTPGGPANGTATLTLTLALAGLAEPVVFTWTIGGA